MSFFSEYGTVIIFYALIILLIYIFRRKFEFQGRIIALLKTKLGVKLMHKWGEKASGFIKVLAYIGIIVGFVGMVFATWTILQGLYNLFFVPDAPASFSPVIPGVKIPGSAIYVPFWYGIIALFVTIVVHEFSHGVVAQAYKIKIKSSGVGMMGPIPLAFVEPDEKQLQKASNTAQLSVFAAGPWSNVILAVLIVVLFGFTPIFAGGIDTMYGTHWNSEGLLKANDKMSIFNYYDFVQQSVIAEGIIINPVDGYPAANADIPNGTTITILNGVNGSENFTLFMEALGDLKPGEEITLGNETNSWTLVTDVHPENESKGYLGVMIPSHSGRVNQEYVESLGFWYEVHRILMNQFMWIILLSLGIGLTNLLPAGPVDGGKMFLIALNKGFKKNRAMKIWGYVGWFILISIILLVFIPIIKALAAGFI